jgi:gluconolactonase
VTTRTALFLSLLAALASAQDFSGLQVERVVAGRQFSEGPVWSPEGYLLFTDIPANRIYKYTPGEGLEVARENSGAANGLALDSKGRLYTCEGGRRRVIRMDSAGKVEVLAERFEGQRFNAPNDIAVRRDGHLWFTDPAFGAQAGTRDMTFYGVYHLTPKGELSAVHRSSTRPNGVALSPNGRILYVAYSDDRAVRAWDIDRSGAASAERVLITGIEGVPDGLKTDEKGNLYVTCRGVAIYSPAGKLIRMIETGETPANLAFGDPDLQTLYVTARTSVYRIRMPVKGATP